MMETLGTVMQCMCLLAGGYGIRILQEVMREGGDI